MVSPCNSIDPFSCFIGSVFGLPVLQVEIQSIERSFNTVKLALMEALKQLPWNAKWNENPGLSVCTEILERYKMWQTWQGLSIAGKCLYWGVLDHWPPFPFSNDYYDQRASQDGGYALGQIWLLSYLVVPPLMKAFRNMSKSSLLTRTKLLFLASTFLCISWKHGTVGPHVMSMFFLLGCFALHFNDKFYCVSEPEKVFLFLVERFLVSHGPAHMETGRNVVGIFLLHTIRMVTSWKSCWVNIALWLIGRLMGVSVMRNAALHRPDCVTTTPSTFMRSSFVDILQDHLNCGSLGKQKQKLTIT